jgi:hypothetical protein
LAFGEGLTVPFTPPTSRNIFAGVLAATFAGDPASTAIRTASHAAENWTTSHAIVKTMLPPQRFAHEINVGIEIYVKTAYQVAGD